MPCQVIVISYILSHLVLGAPCCCVFLRLGNQLYSPKMFQQVHVYGRQSVTLRKNMLQNGKNHCASKPPFSFKSSAVKELNSCPHHHHSTPCPHCYMLCAHRHWRFNTLKLEREGGLQPARQSHSNFKNT